MGFILNPYRYAAGSDPLAEAILALSPLGYWKLDESSGSTAADSSGNGRNGTYSGAGHTLGAYTGPDGVDYASFTAGGRVIIADDDVWSADTASGITAFALIRPDSQSVLDMIVCKGANTTKNEWGMFLDGSGGLYSVLWNPPGSNRQVEQSSSSLITNDQWSAVAMSTATVTVGDRMTMYIDDSTPISTTQGSTASGTYTNDTASLVIASDAVVSAGRTFDGGIAHVAVFAGEVDLADVFDAAAAAGWF